MSLIMIIDESGSRLCRDGKWRGFAIYGSVSSAVRTYKRVSDAIRVAKHNTHGVGRVVVVPSDESVTRDVEASGKVIEYRPTDTPGYVTVSHAELTDFLV